MNSRVGFVLCVVACVLIIILALFFLTFVCCQKIGVRIMDKKIQEQVLDPNIQQVFGIMCTSCIFTLTL